MHYTLISIIIPTYNSNEKLTRLINSIPNKYINNLEIIVIDDCSTINQSIYIENINVKFTRLNENVGQGAARNHGAKIANGKYLFFCDSDDYLISDKFNEFIEFLIKENIDVDLIRMGFKQMEESKKVMFTKNYLFNDLNKYLIYCFFRKRKTSITTCSHIYKREIFLECLFSEVRLCSEDLDHFFAISEKIKSIYITNFNMYFYDRNNIDSTTNKYSLELIKNQEIIYIKYISKLKNNYLLLILCLFYWFFYFPKSKIYIKHYLKKLFISFFKCIIPILFYINHNKYK